MYGNTLIILIRNWYAVYWCESCVKFKLFYLRSIKDFVGWQSLKHVNYIWTILKCREVDTLGHTWPEIGNIIILINFTTCQPKQIYFFIWPNFLRLHCPLMQINGSTGWQQQPFIIFFPSFVLCSWMRQILNYSWLNQMYLSKFNFTKSLKSLRIIIIIIFIKYVPSDIENFISFMQPRHLSTCKITVNVKRGGHKQIHEISLCHSNWFMSTI